MGNVQNNNFNPYLEKPRTAFQVRLNSRWLHMKMETDKTKLRPMYRFFCNFMFVIFILALLGAAIVEQPRPWNFLIGGGCMTIFWGYLGITGKIPKN
jgi:hypothetical protein